jgi:hypothetical protein
MSQMRDGKARPSRVQRPGTDEPGQLAARTAALRQKRRREGRSEQNKSQHQRLRSLQDHILLRLHKGDRLSVDTAAGACGLSRAAFAQLYLVPFAEALTPERVKKLAVLGSRQRLGLASVFGRRIDQASISSRSDTPASELSAEFDELFDTEP